MGCGASKDPKIAVADSHKPVENSNTSYKNPNRDNSNKNSENQNRNGFKKVELKSTSDTHINESTKIPTVDNKKPLAFVIQFDENRNSGELHRPPPGRLRLEPIKPIKKEETLKQINEKMQQAEYNRQKMLKNRVKSSKKRQNRSENFDYEPDDPYYANPSEYKGKEFKETEFDAEEQMRRERLLKSRRIMKANFDEDIEHDKNYRQSEDEKSAFDDTHVTTFKQENCTQF